MSDETRRAMIEALGERLREKRTALRTRREVALGAGVSEWNYGRWEAGHSAMPAVYLPGICRALGIQISEVFSVGQPPPRAIFAGNLARIERTLLALDALCHGAKPPVSSIFADHLDELHKTLLHLDGRPDRTGRASSKRPRPPSPGPYTVQEPAPGALVQDPPVAYQGGRRRRRPHRPSGPCRP
jgi:transcriptional regulator with XRE-family HTH domain